MSSVDPGNPLGLVLCSFYIRGCKKGADCFYIHTNQVKRFYGHPWYPYFSYIKPPNHVDIHVDVKVDVAGVNRRLKAQSIKTLRFCKAYPACSQGKYCAFLHDERIPIAMMEQRIQCMPPVKTKPLSPNASPFSPRPVEAKQFFLSSAILMPNVIPSPISSPISLPVSSHMPLSTSVPTMQKTSIYSLYPESNFKTQESKPIVKPPMMGTPFVPKSFEEHLQMASPFRLHVGLSNN